MAKGLSKELSNTYPFLEIHIGPPKTPTQISCELKETNRACHRFNIGIESQKIDGEWITIGFFGGSIPLPCARCCIYKFVDEYTSPSQL